MAPRHRPECASVDDAVAFGTIGLGEPVIEILGFDPSVLVAILNELELRGFAARRRDRADRLRHIVAITAAGAEALCEVDRHVGEVERQLFADLDENEIENLHGLLARIRTNPYDPPAPKPDRPYRPH